jgi:3-methyl-2-oxobutanoate hydroxymethyltransferase
MAGGRERFVAQKQSGEPITMLTCYDYPTAAMQDEAGIDVIFVGDSLGTNVLGYQSETEVTMADMLHHLRAVRRGVQNAYLLVDMPHLSFRTPEVALENARALIEGGAQGVKLEGGSEQREVVRTLVEHGIDVCGHIGFTPQTLSQPGGKGRVQGKSFEGARALVESADVLESAGVMMLVLELVTEGVAELITSRLRVPTIGIGSGPSCDGQVLVMTDLVGISPFTRKISHRYAEVREAETQAFRQYHEDVKARRFPTSANAFPTDSTEMERLRDLFGAPTSP